MEMIEEMMKEMIEKTMKTMIERKMGKKWGRNGEEMGKKWGRNGEEKLIIVFSTNQIS